MPKGIFIRSEELKKNIAEEYNYICQYCGKLSLKGIGCPHHFDYNKNDKNCIWVCKSCNSKFNANRDYWFAFWCYHLNIEPYSLFLKYKRKKPSAAKSMK
ncbi:hypothetical protein KY343_03625 [Candidatus Woesearchaeota archaeon]|nr:hypothetical protein [Candidatus Woesearchaeota archaeon]